MRILGRGRVIEFDGEVVEQELPIILPQYEGRPAASNGMLYVSEYENKGK